MTEEKLNNLEALAKDALVPDHGRYDAVFRLATSPATILSLIRLARVGLAVTPRPFSEAPRDGMPVLGWRRSLNTNWYAIYFADNEWRTWGLYSDIWEPNCFSDFIPLSALPKPGDRT